MAIGLIICREFYSLFFFGKMTCFRNIVAIPRRLLVTTLEIITKTVARGIPAKKLF